MLEAALRRERLIVAAGLAAIIVLAWAYVVPAALDMYGSMSGLSAWTMSAAWDARYFLLVFLMWCVMMAAMMLPGAAPTILLYGATVRTGAEPEQLVVRTYAFAAGYLAAWAGFSLAATTVQWLLSRAALMSPMMESTSVVVGASILILAGVYQWTPLKRVCLAHCRSPIHWLAHHWRPGVGGAVRMGVSHGMYCLGCCWALMLLLFFGGIMNLVWIVPIAAFVLVEKLAPRGDQVGRVGGALLILAGVWLLAQ